MKSLSEIVTEIKNAAEVAAVTSKNPEKTLRDLVSPIWETFLKQKRFDLRIDIRDELILHGRRADTVFNKLILEYKKPHVIHPDNKRNRQLIAQVQGYILDLADKERFKKERLLGVAFDGCYFIFMRYVKRWMVDDPVFVSEKTLELFLKNLEKLTSKAALIPENLIQDFAVGRESRNKVAVDCIKAFYNEIHQHGEEGDTKEHVFFEQWKTQFAEVHGSLEQKKIDKKTLFTSYGFSKKEQQDFNVDAFFFALDSYYALLMKLLSYQVVGYYTLKGLTGLPLHDWEELASDDLRPKLKDLEEGGIFRQLGIRNFLEGDLFSWYTQAWKDEIHRAIKQIIKYLNDYDPETMELAPDETRDILKKLYQYLVPKQIRHDLGEYYTPDWLAERCLNQLNYNGDPKLRILDPGSGSGTFLVLAIKRAKEYGAKKGHHPAETLNSIFRNIYGFDLNPLAVISARTNYMLAIAELLPYKKGDITIPVYLCDSINPPQARKADEMTFFERELPYQVKTSVGSFLFPHEVVSKRRIQELANLLEDGVKNGQATKDFLARAKRDLKISDYDSEETGACLIAVYEKLLELEEKGVNGIWSRIIKNAFAPLFVGQFDLVVGNPPWVNWESLPLPYRDQTRVHWDNYGLISQKGQLERMRGGKKDISMLMTYAAIDKYLCKKGKLCFVITQSLFKSEGAGDGFRRFRIGKSGEFFRIDQIDDMVELQPFEGATNRTAVMTLTNSEKMNYPVPYILWRKKLKGTVSIDLTLSEVNEKTKRLNLKAKPIGKSNTSPWLSVRPRLLDFFDKVNQCSYYSAREGCNTGGANGVYWLDIIGWNGQQIEVKNLNEVGRKIIPPYSQHIEMDLVYPLLRGRDISRWYAEPEFYIILPQDRNKQREGIAEDWLKQHYPLSYDFLKFFETILESRADRQYYPIGSPFYTMRNVAEYTYAPYKVVWKEQSTEFQCAVTFTGTVQSIPKPIIPNHKIMYVPLEDETEAHFIASCLNSSVSRYVVKAYVISTQQGTHILKNIGLPKFEKENQVHLELSKLSKICHEKTAAEIEVVDLEERIDELTAELWGLTQSELQDIKDSLEELQ